MAGSNSFAAIVYPDVLIHRHYLRIAREVAVSGPVRLEPPNEMTVIPIEHLNTLAEKALQIRLWIIKQDPRCAHKGRTQRSRFLPRMAHRRPTIARSSGAIGSQSGDSKVALS